MVIKHRFSFFLLLCLAVANNGMAQGYDYSKEYHKRLDGMVERRMRRAIISVGSYWYTAWVNAGQPDLKKLINRKQSAEEKKIADEQEKKYKEGKIIGRPDLE